eukprot:178106-Chlamydomonas_euryale.AAC.7
MHITGTLSPAACHIPQASPNEKPLARCISCKFLVGYVKVIRACLAMRLGPDSSRIPPGRAVIILRHIVAFPHSVTPQLLWAVRDPDTPARSAPALPAARLPSARENHRLLTTACYTQLWWHSARLVQAKGD